MLRRMAPGAEPRVILESPKHKTKKAKKNKKTKKKIIIIIILRKCSRT
jgi:hypothetical protein